MDLTNDPHIRDLLEKPRKIGKYHIKPTKILVRHRQGQKPSRKTQEIELINLAQLIETCRFQKKNPAWLPDFLVGRYDAYLIRRDDQGAIGLACHRGLEYNAVSWIDKTTFHTRLVAGEAGDGEMKLTFSPHAIERYLQRWAPQTVEDGQASLWKIARKGVLSPDFPAWFDGQDQGGPFAFVIISGDTIIPTAIEARDRPRNLVAKTFLFRDMHNYRGGRLPESERVKRYDSW